MAEIAPKDKTKTKQDYGTDPKFWNILNGKYDFKWDLACHEGNCLVTDGRFNSGYLHPYTDSLAEDWHLKEGWLYLNPPFKDIKPWARKCVNESLLGAKVVMLTPASVGSIWFHDWVMNKAHVMFLKGRLTFAGETAPYPKDCMISIFDNFHRGVNIWDWRKDWRKG